MGVADIFIFAKYARVHTIAYGFDGLSENNLHPQ
jgi:hypothetical protein